MNPAVSIQTLLQTAGVGTIDAASGWSIRAIREQASPDTHVTCYNTGGLQPNPKYLLDFPSAMVRVRGAPHGYTAARAKAQVVKDTLLGLESQDIDGDRWVSVRMIGDLNELGFDDNDRPMFTLNFTLILEPTTGDNRVSL